MFPVSFSLNPPKLCLMYLCKIKSHSLTSEILSWNLLILSPCPTPAWDTALRSLAHLHNTVPPDDNFNRGYFLPPAQLFVSPSSPANCTHFFISWLTLQPIVIHALSTCPLKLTNKKWHDMLDVVSGKFTEQTQAQTKAVKNHNAMVDTLKGTLESTS